MRSQLPPNTRRVRSLLAVPGILAMLLTAVYSPANHVAGAQTASPLVFDNGNTWASAWSYNPYAGSYDGGPMPYMVLLPLGEQLSGSSKYVGFLADKFAIRGHTLTIGLRRDAKWQNGRPVTPKDVLVTFLISALEGSGSGIWPFISSISTPTATSIKMVVKPGDSPVTFLDQQVIGTSPIPAFEYQHLLPNGGSNLAKLVKLAIAENQEISVGVPTAHAKEVAKTLTPAFKKVADFGPRTAIGDGPYRLVSQTTLNAKLVKSSTYFDAKSVHVPVLVCSNVAQLGPAISELAHQQIDFGEFSFDNLLQAHLMESTGVRLVAVPDPVGWNFFFNAFKYPFNNEKVRQAISYASDIPSLGAAGVGRVKGINPHVWFPSQKYSTGLSIPLNKEYLTPDTFKSLNSYTPSRAKATSLLEGAGFHKKNGSWYLPSGAKFTFNINLDDEQGTLQGLHLGSVLQSFGIDAKPVELPNATLVTDIQAGNFVGLSYYWGQLTADPLASIQESLTTVNAPKPADDMFNVPGIGKVNIVKAATTEAATVGPGSKMNTLVNDWARFLNREAFFITYSGGDLPYELNTDHYVGWPKVTNRIWRLQGGQNVVLGAMITDGYLKPHA